MGGLPSSPGWPWTPDFPGTISQVFHRYVLSHSVHTILGLILVLHTRCALYWSYTSSIPFLVSQVWLGWAHHLPWWLAPTHQHFRYKWSQPPAFCLSLFNTLITDFSKGINPDWAWEPTEPLETQNPGNICGSLKNGPSPLLNGGCKAYTLVGNFNWETKGNSVAGADPAMLHAMLKQN